jgi:hypothetical protein
LAWLIPQTGILAGLFVPMPVPTVIWIIAQFGWHARDVTARLLPKWFCFGKRAVGTLRILENGRDARLLTAGKGRGTKPGDCGAASFADGRRRSRGLRQAALGWRNRSRALPHSLHQF